MKIDKKVAGAFLVPLGLALPPVISMWKANSAEVPLTEALLPLGLTAFVSLLLTGIFLALLRRKSAAMPLVAVLVSVFWLMFWGYSLLRDRLMELVILFTPSAAIFPDRWALPAWTGLTAALLLSLGLVRRWMPVIARGLAAMSALLMLLAMPWQGVRMLTSPKPPPAAPPGPRKATDHRPDIYVIVLDGYARNDVLRTLHQYDDSAFLEGLKSRGFQIGTHSQANYIQTALALGSLFRMDYWPQGKGTDAVVELMDMSPKCPLKEYMAAHRYRSIAYLSSGPLGEGLLQETIFSEGQVPPRFGALENLLLDLSPLGVVPRGEDINYSNHRQRLRNTLKRLGEPPPAPDPYLVFCHILLPHPPFVFGPNGEERTPPIPYSIGDATGYRGKGEDYGQAYSDQVRYVGPQVLKAIDALRKNSGRPAAILLMGDHGSRRYTDWDTAEHTYMPEAFGNLLAVYVPDDKRARFGTLPEHPTPLTTFRQLLNATLDEKLPPLPDHSYYSTLKKAFDFIDVAEAARKPVSAEEAKRVHPSDGR